MPRKMRRAALRSALSVKAAQSEIVVVDALSMSSPKTKALTEALNVLVGPASVLILMAENDDVFELSARNIPQAKLLNARYLNVRDLMGFDRLIVPLNALDAIQSYLGANLRRPIVTEKSSYQSGDLNQYAFEVHKKATKAQIKEAVEAMFDVNVMRVNVMNVPPKRTRRARSRRLLVRRSSMKKAVVTLAPGQTIDVFEGVK
jgi:ribosomal protein L23